MNVKIRKNRTDAIEQTLNVLRIKTGKNNKSHLKRNLQKFMNKMKIRILITGDQHRAFVYYYY